MQITGGKIIFGRTVQPAQYESKKAEVELSFVLADGESLENTLDVVSQMAQAKCLEMVGLAKPAAAPAKQTSVPTTPKPTEVKGAGVEDAIVIEETKPATKTKADLEKEQAAKLSGRSVPPGKPHVRKPPAAKPAPAPESVEEVAEISTGDERIDPAQVEGIDDDVLGPVDGVGTEAVETISDEELTSSITKHNAKIKNPVAIRGLIAQYFPGQTGKQARDLPQERRKEFLEKLVTL